MDDQNFMGSFNIDPLLPARGSQSNQQRKNIGLKAIDVNDYEEKLRMADNTPKAIKMYFELEKVEVLVPNTNKTTFVLMLFDIWSGGVTVGANLEGLDKFETPQRKNIILSSINGVEWGQMKKEKLPNIL